jgi:hypothetical protein
MLWSIIIAHIVPYKSVTGTYLKILHSSGDTYAYVGAAAGGRRAAAEAPYDDKLTYHCTGTPGPWRTRGAVHPDRGPYLQNYAELRKFCQDHFCRAHWVL